MKTFGALSFRFGFMVSNFERCLYQDSRKNHGLRSDQLNKDHCGFHTRAFTMKMSK